MKTNGAPAPRRPGRGRARLVELHPLDPLGLQQHDPVSAGWSRALTRGPPTVSEVLTEALTRMEAEDRAEAYRCDPVTWLRAERARRSLFWRLFGRR
jgi:hypothetical protein